MANPITSKIHTGTLGELFVQLKLLEYGIQAAPPLKDSGNDLIAIKDRSIKLIQIKTRLNKKPYRPRLSQIYDLIVLVELFKSTNNSISYDKSRIWIMYKDSTKRDILTRKIVDKIWQ